MRWMLLALVLACDPSSRDSDESSGGEDTEDTVEVEVVQREDVDDGDDGRERALGECPARFNTDPPSCEADDHPNHCPYAEGNCYCGSPMHCGGAAPEPIPPRWICEANTPPCAAEGTPCSEPGASCATHPCGWSGVQCTNGTWQSYHHAGPP